MATPVRPDEVPEEAVCYPPGLTQRDTILSVERQVKKQNYQTISVYAQGLYYWSYNAQTNVALGIPVPPLPQRPEIADLELFYADVTGTPVSKGEAVGEDTYCWAWQTAELWSPFAD